LGPSAPAWEEVDVRSATAALAPSRGDRRAAVQGALPLGPEVIVITGSAASVTERADWIVNAEHELARAVERGAFILGICFGHQLLAQALGGQVGRNPRGREIGTVPLELAEADPLLDGAAAPFLVNMTHVDTISELPPGARIIGRTELDPSAAVRFGERVWGVQFHPEIDARIMADYVAARSDAMVAEGLDPDEVRARIAETPAARAILGRFLDAVRVADCSPQS
jgi:GMP synthase (glutamine-hydrolysing)